MAARAGADDQVVAEGRRVVPAGLAEAGALVGDRGGVAGGDGGGDDAGDDLGGDGLVGAEQEFDIGVGALGLPVREDAGEPGGEALREGQAEGLDEMVRWPAARRVRRVHRPDAGRCLRRRTRRAGILRVGVRDGFGQLALPRGAQVLLRDADDDGIRSRRIAFSDGRRPVAPRCHGIRARFQVRPPAGTPRPASGHSRLGRSPGSRLDRFLLPSRPIGQWQ